MAIHRATISQEVTNPTAPGVPFIDLYLMPVERNPLQPVETNASKLVL